MRNLLFFLISMLIAGATFGQARSLVVQNQTNCVQYYLIYGDEICRCGDIYQSNLIAINPGVTHTYPTSVSLGGTYPMGIPCSIVGAKIPNGPTGCGVPGGVVGEQPCGLPLSYTYMSLLQNCAPCTRTTVRWLSAPNCDNTARLVFSL